MVKIKYSVVVPVYKNEGTIPRLLDALTAISQNLHGKMEVVFVVDGSPDRSFSILRDALGDLSFPAQVLAHSRNFGSFPAIRSGLIAARGQYFAVMAADLQEPPELLLKFFAHLEKDDCDIVVGTRLNRADPFMSRISSKLFWWTYRHLIIPEMPEGGVDVFGCNKIFAQELLRLEESRSSLIALIFWLGFRRKEVNYERLARLEGKSSWTFRKKFEYMLDSIFAFTDYPVQLLTWIGVLGCILSSVLGTIVFAAHMAGTISVPGYAATILVVLFFGALNLLGLGLVGTYAWRGYENSKKRPLAIVTLKHMNVIGSNVDTQDT